MSGSGLLHVSSDEPGIRRHGRQRFSYVREHDGSPVRDRRTLARIEALVIPPAWTDVWICGDAAGHIQATGRDARGRKQYRYHERYRAQREQAKFADLVPFGEALPDLRRAVEVDLRARGLPRERVLALVIALLDRSALRIGNHDYARANGTFGLTTLRSRHATVDGSAVRFRFVGKGGKVQESEVVDRRLAGLVRRCQALPGQLLFRWQCEDEELHPVHSHDVNDRLRELTGLDVTAKTFRTWWASVDAARLLAERDLAEDRNGSTRPPSKAVRNRAVVAAVDEVAERLGNTRSVARASYVHPRVIEAFEDGRLGDWWDAGPSRSTKWLDAEERKLLHVLRRSRRQRPSAA
jgi:DNA topoisomerase-1